MAARPGIVASATKPADGGESPNRVKPVITAELRVFWPPAATDDQIMATMAEATLQALRLIAAERKETS